MTAQPKPNDPSMEDILASIRRIIADDQAKVAVKPEPPAPANQADVDDVFNLTADMTTDAAEAPAPEPEPDDFGQDDADVLFREIQEDMAAEEAPEPEPGPEFAPPPLPAFDEPEPAYLRPMEPPRAFEPEPASELLSPQVSAAVSGAFSQLAHTVLTQNARTLDDLVQEMLRPMLKSWIDENLPGMVERLVRAEIERVARGKR
mgnify:CR=1 FL=1